MEGACNNCAIVIGIGCYCCCQFRCNVEKTRAALAFLPPQPASYSVKEDPRDRAKGTITYMWKDLQEAELYKLAAACSEVHWLESRKGTRVPAVWVRPAGARGLSSGIAPTAGQSSQAAASRFPPGAVLLHCHGNATDIGIMMGHYYELASILGIDVVGVEYTGYGAAGGAVHTAQLAVDMEAAYDLVTGMGVPPSRIVAYGQSVGSAPAVHLASAHEIGGLILHSPLASALKVIEPSPEGCCRPSCVICCFDAFKNDRLIPSVTCPVFIMHGECDSVVPLHNALRLYHRCQDDMRWPAYFVPRADHNDLVDSDPQAYFERVEGFLTDVKARASSGSRSKDLVKKPVQVQMQAPFATERRTGPDVKEGGFASYPCVVGAAGTGAGVSEPKAGPEDGRYELVRQGDIMKGTAKIKP